MCILESIYFLCIYIIKFVHTISPEGRTQVITFVGILLAFVIGIKQVNIGDIQAKTSSKQAELAENQLLINGLQYEINHVIDNIKYLSGLMPDLEAKAKSVDSPKDNEELQQKIKDVQDYNDTVTKINSLKEKQEKLTDAYRKAIGKISPKL